MYVAVESCALSHSTAYLAAPVTMPRPFQTTFLRTFVFDKRTFTRETKLGTFFQSEDALPK